MGLKPAFLTSRGRLLLLQRIALCIVVYRENSSEFPYLGPGEHFKTGLKANLSKPHMQIPPNTSSAWGTDFLLTPHKHEWCKNKLL